MLTYLLTDSAAGGWNPPRRVPTRTRSDDLTTVGRSERRTSRSSHRRTAVQRSAAARGPSQRPLIYAYNDNGSMVDVRCEPAEWTIATATLCNSDILCPRQQASRAGKELLKVSKPAEWTTVTVTIL